MSQNNLWLFKYNPDIHRWKSIETIKKGFEENGYWSQKEWDIGKYEGDIKDGDIFICLNKKNNNIEFMCNIRKPSIQDDFDYIEPHYFVNVIKCEEVFGVIPEKLYEVLVPPGKEENTRVSLFNLLNHTNYMTKLINKIVEKNPEKKDEVMKYIQGLDSKEQKIAELTETLQRLQAEFQNYKKRTEKETQLLSKYASQVVIAKLLPVLDSFELALKNTNTEKDRFIKGIEIIYAQFFSVLESEGIKPIKAVGKKFDPYYHEVLLQEPSEKEEDIVLEEFQKGYMINDRVIRFAKVKLSKKA